MASVRARLTNKRIDQKSYPARLQELPALYCNAKYHRVVSYTGDRPFSKAEITQIAKPTGRHPWSFWQGTESWSAVVDDDGYGLGLITPKRTFFTGGFAGKPGSNSTHANSCSYLAGQEIEILDHNIVYEYQFKLVVGTTKQIRAIASSHRAKALPGWRFGSSRQGWHYVNAIDSGWPIRGGLRVKLDQADPQLISPYVFCRADEAPEAEIRMALQTNDQKATIYWQNHDSQGFQANNFLQFPIIGDGRMRSYRINLTKSPNYKGGIIRFRIDPSAGNKDDSSVIELIRLVGNKR